MSDPYAILGVKPSASDEEVKRAYRDLVKKYHPDNYQNNPLSDLAEEKMKEVNEAYDLIVKQRAGGGGRSYSGGGSTQSSSQGGSAAFMQVRRLIDQGNLQEAQQLLEASDLRVAEWYYLMGSIAYRRGWLAEANDHFRMAVSMEPGNQEYRQAAAYLQNQAGRGFQTYGSGGGLNMGNICATLVCWECLCGGGCCN